MHYLSEHQTFASTKSLNNAIYTHIKRNSFELNDTVITTLKMVARYAVKFAGVAHLKASTIANLIGKSEKTARRAIAKLDELGIVKKVSTLRRINGGKGANIIVIQPIPDMKENTVICTNDQSTLTSRGVSGKSTVTTVKQGYSGNEPSYSINHFKYINVLDTAIRANALKAVIPSQVYNELEPFFNADEIYKYYGVLLRAKRRINRSLIIEDCPSPFVDAITSVLYKIKNGKIRNLENYFYSAFLSATSEASRLLALEDKPDSVLFYDWR